MQLLQMLNEVVKSSGVPCIFENKMFTFSYIIATNVSVFY